jgi:hypothetical protein
LGKDVSDEVPVVVRTDAVIDPLAVVVESGYTLVTNVAVPRTSRACNFAAGTEVIRVSSLDQLQELDRRCAS